MRAAVADTSPLNYLVLIGAIDVLPHLFEAVIVPAAVKAELVHARAPAAVRRWAAAPPPWLRIAHALPPAGVGLDHLDAGERAVIALALSLQPDFILIDERAGVAAARAQGLEVLGTLGLLDRAARAGLIDLSGAVAALKVTNFRARQSLFDALLARHQTTASAMSEAPAPPPASLPAPLPKAQLAGVPAAPLVPALVAVAGERASLRFLEVFAANIRNPHTRRAYYRAADEFLTWCASAGVPSLAAVQPVHVATWIEVSMRGLAAPSVKQRLAAIRHLFDWLVNGQVVPGNPAHTVRGPRHVVTCGQTPVLDPAEARALLDSIDTGNHAGLRDRALIGLMVYSFARIGAALGMAVEDVYTQNRRLWVRLREKGGKRHAMPCHHNLEDYLVAYLDGAGLRGDPKGPLFRTIGRGTGKLTRTVLPQANAYAMVRRRAAAAGIKTKLGNHSFRATGITAYLKNGGTLEKAAAMANHASTRTTQLYDRRRDEVSLDEVERIMI